MTTSSDDGRTRSEKRSFQTLLTTLWMRCYPQMKCLGRSCDAVSPARPWQLWGASHQRPWSKTNLVQLFGCLEHILAVTSNIFQDDMSWRWLHDVIRWSLCCYLFEYVQLIFGARCSPSRTTASHWKMPDCWTLQSEAWTCSDQTMKYGQRPLSACQLNRIVGTCWNCGQNHLLWLGLDNS